MSFFRSMTGFGRQTCRMGNKSVAIEIRSLNGKQLDITFKIPEQYRCAEPVLRALAIKFLLRGRVDVIISETTGTILPTTLNEQLAHKYYRDLRKIYSKWKKSDKNIAEPDYLDIVMRMPGLITSDNSSDKINFKKIQNTFYKTFEEVDNYRLKEGGKIYAEIKTRVTTIDKLLEKITPYEQRRIEQVRNRLQSNLEKTTEKISYDKDRLEQEIIYYLEKLDITEEKQRLKTNCGFFLHTLDAEENQGRKLGFIAQEMGREINTLGAKANDSDMQKIIVEMKDELEKIKEQLSNVL